jgi:hypothetical protein
MLIHKFKTKTLTKMNQTIELKNESLNLLTFVLILLQFCLVLFFNFYRLNFIKRV